MDNAEEMGPMIEQTDSNMVSNMGTERPISMPVSGPLSAGRMIIENQ